jgi:RNA-directed DNA polymerase
VYNLKKRGGIKRALHEITKNIPDKTFVFKTDVKSYFSSIPHRQLFAKLNRLVPDKAVVQLIKDSLAPFCTPGHTNHNTCTGIPAGSPLSHLLGAVALMDWDKKMQKCGYFYA